MILSIWSSLSGTGSAFLCCKFNKILYPSPLLIFYIIPCCHISLMRANLITEQKAEHNSIKRFRISRRNTTDEQYSLWQTAGKVRGRLILKYTNTNTNTNTNTQTHKHSLWQTAGRVRGRLQSPTNFSPSGFSTTAL